MTKRINKAYRSRMNIIDSISLELKSLELVEDCLSKLTDKAIRSETCFIQIDDIYLEILSTSLYNSINDIKRIIDYK
jgi:hypothetical protein